MFSKLKKFFSGQAPASRSSDDSIFENLRWFEREQNPWGVRVLDCRPIAQTFLSTTKDQSIAETFNEQRRATGKELLSAPAPKNSLKVEWLRTTRAEPTEGCVFRARQMEDKWDIYQWGNELFFVRSWTGELMYRASFERAQNQLKIHRLDIFVDGDSVYQARCADFLIKSHLGRLMLPTPLPAEFDDPNATLIKKFISVHAFGTFGRWAWFTTFEDTLPVAGIEPTSLAI